MKTTYIISLLSLISTISISAQNTSDSNILIGENGTIQAICYSDDNNRTHRPKSAHDFFVNVLRKNKSDSFVEVKKDVTERFQSFDQYYNGVKVEDTGYTFHYDKAGDIEYVHGNYINIDGIKVKPTISKEYAFKALTKWAKAKKTYDSSSELIIKTIKQKERPALVYKIFLNSDLIESEIYGYVDAHTGKVLYTESAFLDVNTGTFETIYNQNTVTAQTQYQNGTYRLYDDSRGAVIHTKDLNGNTYQNNPSYEITDNDNYWHLNEHLNHTDMAMDIHWGLQKIFDRLYNAHGKNSFDNNGKK